MTKRKNETFVDADDIGEGMPMEYKQESTLDDDSPDTMGDPVGSEERAKKDDVAIPQWYFKKFDLDKAQEPTFSLAYVNQVMSLFATKLASPMHFGTGKQVEANQKQYDLDVKNLIQAYGPLLECEPRDTEFAYVNMCNSTWGKYLTSLNEFIDSAESNGDKEMPDWLIMREETAFGMGRKARLMRDALIELQSTFGLKDSSISEHFVRKAVERQLIGLAKWTYNKHVDSSGRVATKLNNANSEFVQASIANM